MTEEKIGEFAYRIGRLSAKQQWNVVRRLAPVLAAAGPAFKTWLSVSDTARRVADAAAAGEAADAMVSVGDSLDELFGAFGPLATALGELSDDASDYVINACLSVCQVNRQGSTWAALTTRGGDLMFDNLSMATMLRLTMLVLKDNVSSFLEELRGLSPDVPA